MSRTARLILLLSCGAPCLGCGGAAAPGAMPAPSGAGSGGSVARSDAGGVAHTDAGASPAGQGGTGTPPAADAAVATGMDAAAPMQMTPSLAIPASCPTPAPNQPPETLECTGLYADLAAKELAASVREFAPAVALWTDGADKRRYVYLPPGEQIDASNPDSWKFPLGTRFWKELSVGGKRVETRLLWKTSASYWARTAYKWSADERSATRTGGEDVSAGSGSYHIPTTTECDECHKGRPDRVLGFEAVLLGLPGATGLTTAELVASDLLSGSVPAALAVGDDGTGHGSDALSWLHANCGVSCHNANPGAAAHGTGLRMQLGVADASGSGAMQAPVRTTAIGVTAVTARWLGSTRIAAGNPDGSLLYVLMSTRNPVSMKDQMPPIASRVVPAAGAQLIHDWITAMK